MSEALFCFFLLDAHRLVAFWDGEERGKEEQ